MAYSKASDKRRYLRYEVLDYALVQEDAQVSVSAVIVDIGLGGLQIRSKTPLQVGRRCQIQIGRINAQPLVLAGEIRHSGSVEGTELIATGIRFCPQSHDERLAIAEYVHGVFQRQCDKLLV